MEFSAALVVACIVLTLLWLSNVRDRKNRLPPGPPPLPLIGNILQIDKNAPFTTLIKLSEKYGPVITLYMGWKRTVVMVGYDAVKDAFVDQGDDFVGRSPLPILIRTNTIHSVGNSNGERWRQLRRFTIATLRDFGMGKKGIEELIREEYQHLKSYIRLLKGKPFNPHFPVGCSVGNVLNCIVLNQRFDYEDKHNLHLLNIVDNLLRFGSRPYGQLYSIFPWLMEHVPGPQHEIFAQLEELKQFMEIKIQEHKDTLDPDSPRDYIDRFLIKIEQEKNNPFSEFNLETLLGTALNLFLAGSETTGSTIKYGLNALIKYPEIQAKVHEEIDAVIGKRSPSMHDRKSLPFTDAVIHEIQRCLDIFPFSIPHCALKDITFRDYTIPEGTILIPHLYSVHKDETQWETPWTFNPKHFLDQDGNFKKNPAFMPFSAGKRACLGESLARVELFIMMVSVMQDFTFSYSGGPDSINLNPEYSSFAQVPQTYEITATPR